MCDLILSLFEVHLICSDFGKILRMKLWVWMRPSMTNTNRSVNRVKMPGESPTSRGVSWGKQKFCVSSSTQFHSLFVTNLGQGPSSQSEVRIWTSTKFPAPKSRQTINCWIANKIRDWETEMVIVLRATLEMHSRHRVAISRLDYCFLMKRWLRSFYFHVNSSKLNIAYAAPPNRQTSAFAKWTRLVNPLVSRSQLSWNRYSYRVFGQSSGSTRMRSSQKVQIYYRFLHSWPYLTAYLV
jgi:hypothetical protein